MRHGAVGARLMRAPVGEANVARAIRDEGAVIGGEGNGGVMLPCSAHRPRRTAGGGPDLASPCASGVTVSQLVESSPRYTIVKAKGPRSSRTASAVRAAAEALCRCRRRRPGWTPALLAGSLAARPAFGHRADRPTDRRGTDGSGSGSTGGRRAGTPDSEEHGAMCGIVGYIGPRQAADLLIEGLRRLEYRGYDSAGHRGRERRRPRDHEGGGQALGAGAASSKPACRRAPSASATPAGPRTARRPRPTRTRTPTSRAGSPSSTTASSRTRPPSGRRSSSRGHASSPRPTPRCWRT